MTPFFSAVGMEPWCGVAAVAIEKALGPPIAASIPTTTAIADNRCAATATAHTAATAATVMITHGNQDGPNMLRRSRTPDQIAVRRIRAAIAVRPSQPARSRHAHVVPMPTRPATAGAIATA